MNMNSIPNIPATEHDSDYDNLEKMSVRELLTNINKEDKKVSDAVARAIPEIEALITAIEPDFKGEGRLFYIGSGTSGRLGVVDASECPPTYGVSPEKVTGIIAGGDAAIRKAQEFAEDDIQQGWKDLQAHNIKPGDWVIGLSASGNTPYVAGALKRCNEENIGTGAISCSPGSAIARIAKFPVVVETGPEFVTGSTRMKAGTAQKLVLNMISTSLMVRIGRVMGNKMVDMQLSNKKLIRRGTAILQVLFGWDEEKARQELLGSGSVRKVLKKHEK
jgi:N-acetylmuramic acid 6-phosphate etherase